MDVDIDDILNLINKSACGSGITRLKSENILRNDFSPAFALKVITKDLTLVQKEGMTFLYSAGCCLVTSQLCNPDTGMTIQ
jgi:3-hydroxyisobutyrate dehydrogenase-like beta-hydroxyacid dehydrogenase